MLHKLPNKLNLFDGRTSYLTVVVTYPPLPLTAEQNVQRLFDRISFRVTCSTRQQIRAHSDFFQLSTYINQEPEAPVTFEEAEAETVRGMLLYVNTLIISALTVTLQHMHENTTARRWWWMTERRERWCLPKPPMMSNIRNKVYICNPFKDNVLIVLL